MEKIKADILITGDLICKEYSKGGVKSTPVKKKTYMNGSMYIVRLLLMVMFLLTASTARSTRLLCAVQTHAKEVAMGNSNGVITAPINVQTDVYKVLGIGAQGGFYDIGRACASDRVNIHSKYCPIVHSKISDLTDAEWEAAAYGFVPQGTTLLRPRPTGGTSSPYRLTDFNRYNHYAINGLAFKQSEYTFDLLSASGANGLTVSLYTDNSLITLKSFVNTLYKGKNIEFQAYANDIYYTVEESLSGSTLSWNIPRSKLLEIDIADDGRVNVQIQPVGYSQKTSITAYLKLVAKTNYSVTGWSYNMLIGNSTGNWKAASNYKSGATSNYIDLNNKSNLYIYDLGLPNGAYNKTYLQMTWTDQYGVVQKQRINLYHDGNPSWSGSTGGTWMCAAADIPVIHPAIFKAVKMCIVGRAADYLGVERIVRITDIVEVNISKKS